MLQTLWQCDNWQFLEIEIRKQRRLWEGVSRLLMRATEEHGFINCFCYHTPLWQTEVPLYPDPWSWGPTEDVISELEHCSSSLSPTACINVLPTDFSLDCAAMQGFFIRQNGEWRLSGALAFRVCLCDIDYICVSTNQFNSIAVLYLKFCSAEFNFRI